MRCLALGQLHSLAVLMTGQVVVWGTDEHGSLGRAMAVLTQRSVQRPARVEGLPPCSSAAVGWKHSAALTGDGRLFTWGWSGAHGAGGGASLQDYGGGGWTVGPTHGTSQWQQYV